MTNFDCGRGISGSGSSSGKSQAEKRPRFACSTDECQGELSERIICRGGGDICSECKGNGNRYCTELCRNQTCTFVDEVEEAEEEENCIVL
jgi:hypothetical protein